MTGFSGVGMVRGEKPRRHSSNGSVAHETLTPEILDQAIADLFARMYRMPEGLSRGQFWQGMRRIWIVQTATTSLWLGFLWFAEQMRALQ